MRKQPSSTCPIFDHSPSIYAFVEAAIGFLSVVDE